MTKFNRHLTQKSLCIFLPFSTAITEKILNKYCLNGKRRSSDIFCDLNSVGTRQCSFRNIA